MRYKLGAGSLVIALALLFAGCHSASRMALPKASAANLRELGRPWPVPVGQFAGPVNITRHDAAGAVFTSGHQPEARHLLNYAKRRLAKAAAPKKTTAVTDLGQAELVETGGRRALVLSWPADPDKGTELSGSIWPSGGGVFAQTADLTGVAFYESDEAGVRLVYYDQITDTRSVWRTVPAWAGKSSLRWSPQGRFLLEESEGKLSVYARDWGLLLAGTPGLGGTFSPAEDKLSFWLPDGHPGLIDLRTAGARSLPPLAEGYQFAKTCQWSAASDRLFLPAGAVPGSQAAVPHLLYAFDLKSGRTGQYPLPAALAAGKISLLGRVPFAEISRLAGLMLRLAPGPLVALAGEGYLGGLKDRLILFTPDGGEKELGRFAGRIIGISLFPEGRRLLISVQEEPRKVGLYAWRLPAGKLLIGAFPTQADLALGGLRLGMTGESILERLGTPAGRTPRRDPILGGIQEAWSYPGLTLTLAAGHLVRIVADTAGMATGRGVKTGAALGLLYDRYGRPSFRKKGYLSFEGDLKGAAVRVAFTLDEKSRVEAILVSRSRR